MEGGARGWRRVSGLLVVIACAWTFGEAAIAAECGSFDENRDGLVAPGDLRALVDEYALLSECMDWDLSEGHPCAPYDFDDDARVTLADYVVVEATTALYLDCGGRLDPARPACGALDLDGDGAADISDASSLEAFAEGFLACMGAGIGADRCDAVDFDGDRRVTLADLGDWSVRYSAGQTCVGARVPAARGLWIDRDRLMALPTSGAAWERVRDEALQPYRAPLIADQDDQADTRTLAKALVGVRLSRGDLVEDVVRALREVTHGESDDGARSLAVARAVAAYVIAADVVDLATIEPALDAAFRDRLRRFRETDYLGRTLVSTQEHRPNNWGTHAAAARIAIALYLGDAEDLAAAAAVHRAWVGDDSAAHDAFRFGSLGWQADPSHPVGINPRGATRSGIDLDGAQPEEMRRGGDLANPPARTGYAWEALQGGVVAAELLARHGHPDVWHWGDDALARAVDYLYRLDSAYGGWWAEGDDRWIVWLVNRAYARTYPTETGVSPGKGMGFTDWTHAE